MTPEQIFNAKKTYFQGKKGLIFDMDGTLIDSMQYWWQLNGNSASGYPSFAEYMLDKYNNAIEPKAYALELLALLRENGVPVAIASDTPLPLAEGFLRKYGIDSLIDYYVSSADVGVYKRESVKVFNLAAEKMGLAPEECVIFEDRLNYIKQAKALGFTVVGVYDDTSRDDMFEIKHIADDFVYNLGKLYKAMF